MFSKIKIARLLPIVIIAIFLIQAVSFIFFYNVINSDAEHIQENYQSRRNVMFFSDAWINLVQARSTLREAQNQAAAVTVDRERLQGLFSRAGGGSQKRAAIMRPIRISLTLTDST
ncbi:Tar ligand binding domain-containing protein [Edwardsiella ictaluri]|uniref:Tar ligand binding domain-containing protein n=1 Tax=Edwardsiella ictaluri TaxID=67780 RepID=UPI0039F67679